MDARTLLLLVSLLFPLAGTPDSVEPDVVEPASGAGDEEEEDEEDEEDEAVKFRVVFEAGEWLFECFFAFFFEMFDFTVNKEDDE